MYTLTRPAIPAEEELERACKRIAPENRQYYRSSSIRDAQARIAEFDAAIAIANSSPEKEAFDLEKLYELYGFEGKEERLVLTQGTGLFHLADYYIRHPEFTTLAEYAKYLTERDRG